MRTSLRSPLGIAGALLATSVVAVGVPLLSSSEATAAAFTGGNLVVYRVGSGAALDNSAAPVFLDEYTAAGSKLQSLALPTAASGTNHALTAAGESRSEGLVTTADGLLAVTGYDAAPGTTGPGGISLTASDPATVGRVIGIVDGSGAIDTSTVLTGTSAPKIVRSALTDGSHVWVAGGNNGLQVTGVGSGTTTTVAGTADTNLTSLTLQGGQLFAGGILGDRLAKIGSGLPTGAASSSALPGLPDNLLTYGYAFENLTSADYAGTGLDTLYLANASERGGAVDKYRWNGTEWASAGSVDVPGVSGLVADVSAGSVSLAVTTPTQLLTLTDGAGAATTFTATPSVLANAPAGTEFRGVALAPTATFVPPGQVLSAGTYSWTDQRVARTGTWKSYRVTKAPGGKGLFSTKKNSTVSLTAQGTKLSLVLGTSPASGKTKVTVDGVALKTIDLYAAKAGTLTKAVPLTAGTHTVVVKVLGTKRAASTGTKVSLAYLKVA